MTVEERQSVMVAMFGEEQDSVRTPADAPHPYADCNVPDAGSVTGLLKDDDEYDRFF